MTDPKSRKLIVVENPLLPIRVKEMMARCLFEDLQVGFIPSFFLYFFPFCFGARLRLINVSLSS